MSRFELKSIEDSIILTYIVNGYTNVKRLSDSITILSKLAIAKSLQKLNNNEIIDVNNRTGAITYINGLRDFMKCLENFSCSSSEPKDAKNEFVDSIDKSNYKNKDQLKAIAQKFMYRVVEDR